MTFSLTASLPQSASSLVRIVFLRKRIFSGGSFRPCKSIILVSSCKPHDSSSSIACVVGGTGEGEGEREGGEKGRRGEEGRREVGRRVRERHGEGEEGEVSKGEEGGKGGTKMER